MHGKLDLGKAKGLKKSEIKQLNRILQQRIPAGKLLTIDLAESVSEVSHSTGHPISVVVNRRGQVVNVTLGHPSEVNMPELRGVRVGPGRLCGHRIIHTSLDSKAAQAAKLSFRKEDLQCLLKNRLDAIAQITVNTDGDFSRSKGEQTRFADVVHIAHILP
ncbi:MAG TPA: hypothetical protein PKZ32_19935, partial [Candidatus Melainabacteria bacterium]|nr:hypothetical protein [Candidatus Melainabacteria bacterium]